MKRLKLAPLLLAVLTTSSALATEVRPMERVSFEHQGRQFTLKCNNGKTYGVHGQSGGDEQIDTAICREAGKLLRAKWIAQDYTFADENLHHEIVGYDCAFNDENGWLCSKWTKVKKLNLHINLNGPVDIDENALSWSMLSSPFSEP